MALLFQYLANGVVEVSLRLSEMSLAHIILERSSVGICLLCIGPVLLLWYSPMLGTIVLSFHFLFMRDPMPSCSLFASEWYSRWPLCRVVKRSSFHRTSPSPITNVPFHVVFFSLILPVLARAGRLVMFIPSLGSGSS